MTTITLESLRTDYQAIVSDCIAMESKKPTIPLHARFTTFLSNVGEVLVNIVRVSNRNDSEIDTKYVRYITDKTPFSKLMDDPFIKPASVLVSMASVAGYMQQMYDELDTVVTDVLPGLQRELGALVNNPSKLETVFGHRMDLPVVDVAKVEGLLVKFDRPHDTAHFTTTFGSEFNNTADYYNCIDGMNDIYRKIAFTGRSETVPLLIKQTEQIAKYSRLLATKLESMPEDERPSRASIKALADYLHMAAVGTEMLASMRLLYGKYHNTYTEHNTFIIRKHKR